ncbi:MAG: myo-inosose-2 dehydratase [Brevinema sp.]
MTKLNPNKIKLGIAPIGWTNDDMPDLGSENTFQQCVSEMALAGFTGCEVGNKYPKDPAVLNKYLKIRGLTVCNAWFSAYFTTQPFDTVKKDFLDFAKFLHDVGSKVMGGSEQGGSVQGMLDKGVFGNKPIFTPEQWKKLTTGVNELGKIVKEEYGLDYCYHHHMGTGVQTVEETERFLADTDPRYVNLNYDCGHFYFSHEDPVAALKKFIGRTKHIHLKDVRKEIRDQAKKEDWCFLDAVRQGVFTVPGDGCLNFDELFAIIAQADYEGYILVEAEQDPAKANPFEYAVMARKFIREKTGL